MKLHLPCSLRKALLAAIAATAALTTSVRADVDNNVIQNHGEVEGGISIGKKKSDSAYGWASGLDFTADGKSACFLGVSTDFTGFDTSVFSLPDLPTMPDSLLPPNPAALAQFALQMIDYAVKLAKMIGETVEVGVLVGDIAGANETDAVYGKNTYMAYDSGKVYNSIISEAYDSGRAGSDTVVGSDIYMATGPAGIPIPIPATGMSKGHQDTSASGYINVSGALVKFSNEVRADDTLSISDRGRVQAVDGPGNVSIKGDISVSGSSTLSAQDIHSDKKIEITGKSTLAAENLSADGGIKLDNSTVASVNNSVTGSSSLTVDSTLEAKNSVIMSATGSVNLKDLNGTGNIVTAKNDVVIDEALKGDTNTIVADKKIEIGEGITGNNNSLNTNNGQIHLGANANGNSIEGNGNLLGTSTSQKTDKINLDGNIKGNNNVLEATSSIITGGIEGNGNNLTVTGNYNANANAPLITVNGSITGDGNKLEIDYNGSIVVKGDISNVTTGGTKGNELTVNGLGNISVSGSVSGNNHLLQTIGGGNIQLGSLGDNNGLVVDANGKITVTGSSNAVLDFESEISATGDIILGVGLATPDKNSTLWLKGGSTMTSTNGNILANQNLVASGLGSMISADKGTITVNATLQAENFAQISAGKIKADNLVVKSGSTVSSIGEGKEIVLNRGELLVEESTVNGNVSGVLTGNISGKTTDTAINGTVTGVGTDSGLQISGLVTVGTKIIDGSISNFETIVLGGDDQTLKTEITINGDVTTSEGGTITVKNGNKVVITDEMTAGSDITIIDSNLTVGGAKDEIKYSDNGYLGTHPLDKVIDHSDMEAGGKIGISNSTVKVYDNMTAGSDIAIVGGSTVTVGSIDQIGNQYAFNYDVVSTEVPAIVATIIAGSSVTGYIMPNVPVELKYTLTHSDMTAGGSIAIGGSSTVKVYDNMTAQGGDITVQESQLNVGTIGDKTYVGKDDTSITVFEKHGNMTAQGNIVLDKSTVNVFQDMTAVTGGIQITDSNIEDAFLNGVAGNASITVGRDQIAGTSIFIENSSVSVGRDQTAATDIFIGGSQVEGADIGGSIVEVGRDQTAGGNIGIKDSEVTIGQDQIAGEDIGILDSEVTIGRDQTAQKGDIGISVSDVTIGSEDQDGNQTAHGSIVIDEDSIVKVFGDQTAQTGGIGLTDSELNVAGNQLAHTNISITNSDATITGSQTATTGQITITDGSNVFVGTEEANADQTAYTHIVISDNSNVDIAGNQMAQTGLIQVLNNSTLNVSGTQTAHTDIEIDGTSTVVVGGNQTAETGHITISDKSDVTVGSEEEAADQTAYSNISISDSIVKVFGDQTAQTDYIQVIEGADLTVAGNQTAGTHILVKDSVADIGGNQTAGTSITIETSIVDVGGNQTAQNGFVSINGSTVTVGDSMLAQSNDGVTEANIVIVGSKVSVGTPGLTGEDRNDMIADHSISIKTSTVQVLDDVVAQNGNIVFVDNTEKVTGSDFAIVIGDSLIAKGDPAAGKGSIEISNTSLEVGNLNFAEGHGNMTADNHIYIDQASHVLVHGDQLAGTEISIDESTVEIKGSQTSNTGYIQITDSDVTIGQLGSAGDQFALEDILISKGSDVTVNGNQTSQTGTIDVKDSNLAVIGDQTAHVNIQIQDDSIVVVNGDQTAQTGSIIVKDSDLTVGTADINGNQTAYADISIVNSELTTIYGNQTAQTGSIGVIDSSLNVTGNQTAHKDIGIKNSDVVIGGNQMAETGSIGIEDSAVTVDGDQFAKTAIDIIKGKEVGADSSVVVIGGNQTADKDYINVQESDLKVEGSQTAGTSIHINKSEVEVGGDQTARKGNVEIAESTVTVGDNMSALSGDGTTIANIIIEDSKVSVGSGQWLGVANHNNMVADSNITIKTSSASILGNMSANNGNISLKDNTTKVTGKDAAVVIGGSMTAKGDKDYKGEAVYGAIAIENTTVQVGTEVTGDMLADNFIDISKNSVVEISGDQQAGSFIQVNGSKLDVDGSQMALTGQIVLTDSSVNIGGDQLAHTDIGVSNTTLDVGGSQTAELGNIIIDKSSSVKVGSGEEGGDQTAGKTIQITDSSLTVDGDQTALTGHILVDQSTLDISGNQTSSGLIDIKNNSDVAIGGSQTALNGNVQIDKSTVTVGDSMLARSSDGRTHANIIITDSSAIVGSRDLSGDDVNNMIADNNITITKSTIEVLGSMGAQSGSIVLTDNTKVVADSNYAVVVRGDMIAVADKSDTEGKTGNILLGNTSLSLGSDMSADRAIIIDKGSKVAIDGDQTAGNAILIGGISNVLVSGDMEVTKGGKEAYSLVIKENSTVKVDGSMTMSNGGHIQMAGGSKVTIGEQLVADMGSLIIEGANTTVNINTDNVDLYGSVISSGIAAIKVDTQTNLNTGNVVLDNANLALNGVLVATAWETKKGVTVVDGTGSKDGLLKVTEGDLKLGGVNQVKSDAKLWATEGGIFLAGGNSITDSIVVADRGAISVASEGSEGYTVIKDSNITAGTTVTIAGAKDSLASVTGKTEIVSSGSEDYKLSNGENIRMGVLLDNVSLADLTAQKDVTSRVGSIVVNNRVDLKETTLFTGFGKSTVMLNGNSVLYMHRGTSLEGTLSSADTSAYLVKNGGDTLALNYSARNYNGVIDVRAHDGSEILINCDGVGHDAVTLLNDTNLTVSREAFKAAADNVVNIGSVDSSYDTGNRYTKDGKLNEVLTNNSYTLDRADRAGFKNIGSFISFNKGNAGDVVRAHNLTMNGNTLVRLEGAVHEDGSMTYDKIEMDGTLDAGGARIFATLLSGKENEAAIQEQDRVQLISISGENAQVKSAFSEDRLYDVALNSETGTYQRNLRTVNSWVETRGDGVYLAYSKHFTHGSIVKNYNQQQVSDVLSVFNDRANHTEGTLGASNSMMDRLIDAFDYTRSEGDLLAALNSVSGRNATLAQHAMMDGNRHHLETLRSSMGMPSCEEASTADSVLKVSKDSTVWMSYTGGYDFVNGDYNMDDYTRSFQGGLLGYERTINCNILVGIDFGYDNAISRTADAKFDANTYFIDLYLGAKTGIVNHKFSVGVGIYDFDTARDINVAAASHTFMEEAKGSMTGTAINAAYEVSADFQIARRAKVSPFLAANFSANQLKDLREKNIGDAGLRTRFDDVSQFDLALGARFVQEFTFFSNQNPATFVASLAARGEFSDHQPEVESSFIADPDMKFRSRSLKRAPFFIQVGSGLSVPFANQWTAQIGGSGEFGNDRASVNGNIGVRYSF